MSILVITLFTLLSDLLAFDAVGYISFYSQFNTEHGIKDKKARITGISIIAIAILNPSERLTSFRRIGLYFIRFTV